MEAFHDVAVRVLAACRAELDARRARGDGEGLAMTTERDEARELRAEIARVAELIGRRDAAGAETVGVHKAWFTQARWALEDAISSTRASRWDAICALRGVR
jgi:hypothetical protein